MTEDDILAFVRGAIGSAWALELLLLLQREPGRGWTADALVRELRGSLPLVTDSLERLTAAGLVAQNESGEHLYRPQSHERAELVSALAGLYASKPIAVLRAIFATPSDKIRSFADAFLFKK